MKKTPPNNYAFIDSQNLNLAIRGLGWKIDWKRFRVYLKDKYKVTKAYLFIGYRGGNEKLYTFLQESGYICIFKPTLELPDKTVKGNVDAELVLHAMIQIRDYTKAIIVSGDGDFHCLAEYLISIDKLEAMLIPNEFSYSSLLKTLNTSSNKYFSFLNRQKEKLQYIKKRAPWGRNPREAFSS